MPRRCREADRRRRRAQGTQTTENRSGVLKPLFGEVPRPLDGQFEDLPGPTGELNRLSNYARGVVLCRRGRTANQPWPRLASPMSQGNSVVVVAPGIAKTLAEAGKAGLPITGTEGTLAPEALATVNGFKAVVSVAETNVLRDYRLALAKREGELLPLITEQNLDQRFVIERHLCIDTTAAGGNASLIASAE